ncbi:MAG: efflux RND transporter permease subunit [Acidobacteria bacterium]|nr:efflux RND transporter permease subunit [Acidobacteriota bacterium]
MRKLISFALHQPLFLFLIVLLFIGGGVAAFRTLPVEAFPDVTDVQVPIITLYAGHAPEEVEKQVTIPLEIGLSGLPHAIRMFSHTQFGLSFVYITFDEEVDHYFARQQILERFQTVELPEGVRPEMGPLTTPVGEIYRTYLKSDTLDASELRSLQDWVVSRHLKTIPGVADVVSRGGFVKQYQVVPDLIKMKAQGVGMQQVFQAIQRGNANAGGGYIEQGQQQFIIRGVGLLKTPGDIENIVVAEHTGVPVRIKDIGEVNTGSVPRQGVVAKDDLDDIVTGIILMRKGENPSVVLNAVKEKMEHLNRNVLPKGVQIVPYYDRAWLIERTLKTVFTNLGEGAILVGLVLYLFLGNFKSAAIVAIIIPLALLGTFLGLKLRGIPANLLSLGAMDFGIIVDGAVIVVENIYRRLSEEGRTHAGSLRDLIGEAAVQVGRPTFFSMLIIILAHLPIFTLQRHEGRIFAPMAYTVTSALIGSLLFSLTLVPLLCLLLLRKPVPERETFVVRLAKRIYQPILTSALKNRYAVIATALVALGASLALVPKLGSEFLPELNEGSVWVNFTLPPGISLTEVQSVLRNVRKTLHKYPEVNAVVSQAGRPEDGTDPKPLNMVEVLVDLKPETEWKRHVSKEAILREMEKDLDGIPGVNPSFSQPIRDNVLESISQIDGQIVVKLFGEDSGVLQKKIDEVLGVISPVPGVARAFVDRAGKVPQLQISVDRERAARYGLNVADIEDVMETALGGKPATQLWEGERRFEVVVRLREDERRNLDSLKALLIDTPGGSRIPLDQVANISVQEGAMNISREAGLRVASIGVFIRDRDMGSVVAEMQEKVKKSVQLPAGYFLEWGGEFENQERAMKRLGLIVPVSVLLIFVLLFEAFKSVNSATLILLNVPFALIGGILALYITGIHLSVSAAIGFIALFGQAVLNGVVMVSYIDESRTRGVPLYEAVLNGALVRFRTVLMTSILAMLGLLPMALSKGIGSEVQRPLAVVIIGGLVSATILTLVVLPVVCLVFQRWAPPQEETY